MGAAGLADLPAAKARSRFFGIAALVTPAPSLFALNG